MVSCRPIKVLKVIFCIFKSLFVTFLTILRAFLHFFFFRLLFNALKVMNFRGSVITYSTIDFFTRAELTAIDRISKRSSNRLYRNNTWSSPSLRFKRSRKYTRCVLSCYEYQLEISPGRLRRYDISVRNFTGSIVPMLSAFFGHRFPQTAAPYGARRRRRRWRRLPSSSKSPKRARRVSGEIIVKFIGIGKGVIIIIIIIPHRVRGLCRTQCTVVQL